MYTINNAYLQFTSAVILVIIAVSLEKVLPALLLLTIAILLTWPIVAQATKVTEKEHNIIKRIKKTADKRKYE